MTVSIKMSADSRAVEVELKRAQEAIRRLTEQMKGLGREAKDFGKLDLSGLPDNDTTRALEQIKRQYRDLLALNSDLRRRIQLSGQEGANPLELDWERLGYLNQRTQEENRRRFLRSVLNGTPWQPPPPAPGAEPGPGGAPPPSEPSRGGSLFAGLGGSLKLGLGLLGVSSGFGLVAQAFRSGKEMAVATDLFTRRTRDAGETFDSTRKRLEQLGRDLYLTDTEAAHLGIAFANAANANDPRQATEGARAAIGFGRGYGIDPNIAVQGLGSLQFLGATGRGGLSQRQMLLLIGKTISDGMLSGKAEQVISELGTHVERFVSQTMHGPGDIAQYLGLRAAMGQLAADPTKNLPGLAAFGGNLYQQMTQGLRGNAGGLGAEMLRYRVLGKAGYDPWEIYNLQQSITPMTKLKSGQTYYEAFMDYAQRQFGGRLENPAERERLLAMLSATTGQNPQAIWAFDQAYRQYQTAQRHGGVNSWEEELQRAGIDAEKINPTGFKEIGDIFGAANDPARLREIGARYLQREDLKEGEPRSRLEQAMAGNDATELRHALLRVAGTLGMTQTEGTKIQQTISDLINTINEVIGKSLISAITTLSDLIKRLTGVGESILKWLGIEVTPPGEKESSKTGLNAPITTKERWAAELNPGNWFKWDRPDWMKRRGFGYEEPKAAEAVARERKAAAEETLRRMEENPNDTLWGPPARREELKQEQHRIIERANRILDAETPYQDPRDALRERAQPQAPSAHRPAPAPRDALRDRAQPQASDARRPNEDPDFLARLDTLEQRNGLPPGLLYGIMMQESRGHAEAVSPAGARGPFQFMPDTAREYGIAGQEHDPDASADAAARYLSDLYRRTGDWTDAVTAYHSGLGNVRRGRIGPIGRAYAPGVYRKMQRAPYRDDDATPRPTVAEQPHPGFDSHLLQPKPRDDGYTPLPSDAKPPAEDRPSPKQELAERGQIDIYLHQRDASGQPIGAPVQHRLDLTQRAPRGAVHVENLWGVA